MNKSEIHERIEKVESELATLKADLAKCDDCTDGIEQEKCWHAFFKDGDSSFKPLTKQDCQRYWKNNSAVDHIAYMPECRRVTAEDVKNMPSFISLSYDGMARELHKLGFRMKVTP